MKDEIRLWWKRNPVKTFPMKDGIGVFLTMEGFIHEVARKGNRNIRAYALRHPGSQCAFDLKADGPAVRLADGVRSSSISHMGGIVDRRFRV